MAEADLPSTWSQAGRSLLGNSLWILPLVSLERVFDGHPYQAAIAGVVFLVGLLVAVKLHVLQNFISNSKRRQQLLTWILILAGIAMCGLGLYRLGTVEMPAEKDVVDLQLRLSQATQQVAALQELQSRARAAAPTPHIVSANGKVFTDKTIRQLRAMYENRTALQAEAFIGPEKGQWIDTEGAIIRVDAGMALLQSGDDHIECRFDDGWNPKLATFRHGEILKVRGKIAPHQNGAQIYLQGCELHAD
jgi:hypothetical protein